MTHHLPIDNPRHTEVLGYRVSTAAGKRLWAAMDWQHWWIDFAAEGHLFSSPQSAYFHVRCKDDDPGSAHYGCTYRVRCWYAGRTYRGREVVSVGIGMRNGKLFWIVRTK